LKGLQLAQADADRGALDQERLIKIRDAAIEFVGNIADQDDRAAPKTLSTVDAETTSAVESVADDAPHANLPHMSTEDLPDDWRGECPVLCVAGRSLIDEAAAIMLAQLSTAHGLVARAEGAEALTTANIFRLQTDGVSAVCLVYMDGTAPAHMRYSVRRLRRKLPKAVIILCCWLKDVDSAELERLRETAKADLFARTLGEAVKLTIEAAGLDVDAQTALDQSSGITAA
jgi:hypothetical protein